MNSLAGKALVFALMVALVVTQDPPTSADCSVDNLHFPDPADCTSYYDCFDIGGGEWFLEHATCPAGGMWDQASSSCVAGVCENPTTAMPVETTPAATTPVATTPAVTTTTLPPYSCPSAGLFPDPVNCQGYYQCVFSNGLWYRYSYLCPANTYFNKATRLCTVGTCPY